MRRLPVLALGLVAAGGEAERLAPGPAELAEATAEAARRIERAEALGIALIRVQNAWGETLATGEAPKKPCDDPVARSLFARAAVFGPAWRDAAQAARAQRDRLVEIAAAPTVAPLIGADATAGIESLMARVTTQEVRYAEAIAWQRGNMTLWSACDLSLAAAPGIDNRVPLAVGEHVGTAVIGLGGGLVCPAGAPADGTPVVVDGIACVTASTSCDCTPAPIAPAAVLAP